MRKLTNLNDYKSITESNKSVLLIFYSEKSEKSIEALKILQELEKEYEMLFYSVNVSETKDIHSLLNISSVPTVLSIRNQKIEKKIEGLQNKFIYEMLLYSHPQQGAGEKTVNSVVVYSTPTCTFCNQLKSYLRENKIIFRDIDISRDQRMAEELMRRSGQTGVPQTDINGQLIVGFDKEKINKKLGLNKN